VGFGYVDFPREQADSPGLLAPKGQKHTSPGQRPGCRGSEVPLALKGRNKEDPMPCDHSVAPFQGSNPGCSHNPGRRFAADAAPLCPGLSCYAPSGQETEQTLAFPTRPISHVSPNFASPEAVPLSGMRDFEDVGRRNGLLSLLACFITRRSTLQSVRFVLCDFRELRTLRPIVRSARLFFQGDSGRCRR